MSLWMRGSLWTVGGGLTSASTSCGRRWSELSRSASAAARSVCCTPEMPQKTVSLSTHVNIQLPTYTGELLHVTCEKQRHHNLGWWMTWKSKKARREVSDSQRESEAVFDRLTPQLQTGTYTYISKRVTGLGFWCIYIYREREAPLYIYILACGVCMHECLKVGAKLARLECRPHVCVAQIHGVQILVGEESLAAAAAAEILKGKRFLKWGTGEVQRLLSLGNPSHSTQYMYICIYVCI